jgi:hypothetical protein
MAVSIRDGINLRAAPENPAHITAFSVQSIEIAVLSAEIDGVPYNHRWIQGSHGLVTGLEFYFPPHPQGRGDTGGTKAPAPFAPKLHPVRPGGTAGEEYCENEEKTSPGEG